MQTETSSHYWNGREARRKGTPRDHGAAFRDRLRRRAWLQGWEDEDTNLSRAAMAARTPEIIREHEEGRQWFAEEFTAWKQEIEANP